MLVVPIEAVDHWLDASDELRSHLMDVAARIGRAQMQAFSPRRVGVIIAGLEVPHLHVHVIPMESEQDLNFANADHTAKGTDLDTTAIKLREAMRALGESGVVG